MYLVFLYFYLFVLIVVSLIVVSNGLIVEKKNSPKK